MSLLANKTVVARFSDEEVLTATYTREYLIEEQTFTGTLVKTNYEATLTGTWPDNPPAAITVIYDNVTYSNVPLQADGRSYGAELGPDTDWSTYPFNIHTPDLSEIMVTCGDGNSHTIAAY